MIKTIVTIPNWNGSTHLDEIQSHISGKAYNHQYTKLKSFDLDQVSGTLTASRWDWASEEIANEYKTLVETLLNDEYPGMQVSIVIE